jgi:hypothetical protein
LFIYLNGNVTLEHINKKKSTLNSGKSDGEEGVNEANVSVRFFVEKFNALYDDRVFT